ncbi:MAG: ABC transporter permease [Acidobacteriota bacterium]|nr:ABC transporter permease [Acidobacteriota bacterium]
MGAFQDVRYGARMLVKRPGFALVAVLTLALGIGATTAIFTFVDAFLLRPLPYPEADRLTVVFDVQPDLEDAPASFLEFKDWSAQSQSFEQMTALFHTSFNFVGREGPERVRGAQVAENYFALLGARPHAGRGFSAADHQPGAAPVALVGHGLWQNQFGGDPHLPGKSVVLNDTAYTVVGVMPPDAPSFSGQARTEVWVPLEPHTPWRDRGTHYLTVLARLREGVDAPRAQAEMNVVAKRIGEANDSTHGARLVSLRTHLVGDTRDRLLLVFAAVGFVLLIALANVANLLLVRATGRVREFAIRAALGAGRRRLLRQLLTESVLLALLGGAAGGLLAVWLIDLIAAGWPPGVPRPERIGMDWRVLGFTAALSLLAGLLFGLAPAWRAARIDLNESLKENSGKATGDRGGQRTRSLLVVSEIALATMLLLGAGLMLKSFWRLQHVNPGFEPEGLLTLQVSLPPVRYPEARQRAAFFQDVLRRVGALPGVESAGAVNNLPLGGGSMNGDFLIEGGPPSPRGQEPLCEKYIVSAGYFDTMGIPLRRGRVFTERDAPGQPAVVIVNEKMAERFWPGEDPLGRRMSWDGGESWSTVVGVVGDVKHAGLDRAPEFESYVPFLQVPSPGMAVVVRTPAEPTSLVSAVKNEILAVDKEQPVFSVRTMTQIVSNSIARQRLSATLLGVGAALALLLASIGIYGVLAYAVTQRTHEIGVRIALGARAADVLGLVIRQGMGLALIGVSAGLVGALGVTRLLSGFLYGVSATDPLTFTTVALMLAAVALLACYVPARRATKIDPMVALRYE